MHKMLELDGDFERLLYFHPEDWGFHDPIWHAFYFSDGLKLPTSGRCVTLTKWNFRQKVTQQVDFCNNGTHPWYNANEEMNGWNGKKTVVLLRCFFLFPFLGTFFGRFHLPFVFWGVIFVHSNVMLSRLERGVSQLNLSSTVITPS